MFSWIHFFTSFFHFLLVRIYVLCSFLKKVLPDLRSIFLVDLFFLVWTSSISSSLLLSPFSFLFYQFLFRFHIDFCRTGVKKLSAVLVQGQGCRVGPLYCRLQFWLWLLKLLTYLPRLQLWLLRFSSKNSYNIPANFTVYKLPLK